MQRSLIACLLLNLFLPLALLAVVDSSVAVPHINKNISKVQKIRFSANVDTAVIVSLNNHDEFKQRSTYSMNTMLNLTDSSTIFTGFDSHWLLQCRNVKVLKNESFFTLPENIKFIVHSPAKLLIHSYRANIELDLIVNISGDSLVNLDLFPYFESDKNKWDSTQLKKDARQKTEVVDATLNKDTLKIVSTLDYLYNPFGICKDVKTFALKLPGYFKQKIRCFGTGSGSIDTTFNFVCDESHIEVIECDLGEDCVFPNQVSLVSAEIYDSNIVFLNGIRVGISKKQFNKIYFKKIINFENISTVLIESGLTGIWHYYYFENGMLKSIRILTDYQIDK